MKQERNQSCCVADQFCAAAANFPHPDARGICFHCGQNVCSNCSSIRKYFTYGKVRLCNDCQIDIDGNEIRVMKRIRKMAGYK